MFIFVHIYLAAYRKSDLGQLQRYSMVHECENQHLLTIPTDTGRPLVWLSLILITEMALFEYGSELMDAKRIEFLMTTSP